MFRIAMLLIAFLCFDAQAIDRRAPSLVYQRDYINIIPPSSFVVFTKDQPSQPKPSVKAVKLSVSVRGEQALRQHNMHLLQTLKPEHSVMVVMRHPLDIPLMPLPVRNTLDVAFIDERGMIVQIIPNMVLEKLSKDYFSGRPVKAILYMVGGTVNTHQIRPGFVVEHASFSPEPEIMN